MLFDLNNLPYWLLLGIGTLLFILVIASGGGNDDVDIDADADVDIDADGDFDFAQVLGWLGIGKAPLMLLLATDLSLWGVVGWMLNVWVGSLGGKFPGGLLAGIVFFGAMAISLLLGSLIARPIGKIFAEFGEDTSSDRLIGCVGTVSSAVIPSANQGRIGQVDVIDATGNLVTINATLPAWATVIPRRGEKVIVIERQLNTYLIIAENTLDRERWLHSR